MSECLDRLSLKLNKKNKTTFRCKESTDEEASFTIERWVLECRGTLRQVTASKTLLHVDMAASGVLIIIQLVLGLVLGIPLSLVASIGHTAVTFLVCMFLLFLLDSFIALYTARRNYQTQLELAHDLEHIFWDRWK